MPDAAPPAPLETDLYLSANLHVCALVFDPTAPLLIAFASGGQPRHPVGMSMARKHGFNCISVACKAQDWFQYPDFDRAMDAVRDAARGFPRVVAYGFSMGGYGALIGSGTIEPDLVLACSPQAAIGPAVPAGEHRWADERIRIGHELGFPIDDLAARLSRRADLVLVYDPRDFDRFHVRDIEALRPARHLYFPLAGHSTLPLLTRMGFGSKLVLAALDGSLDLPAFQRELLAIRRATLRDELLYVELRRRGRPVPERLLARVIDAPSTGLEKGRLRNLVIDCLDLGRVDLAWHAFARLAADNSSALAPSFVADVRRLAAAHVEPDDTAVMPDAVSGPTPTVDAGTGAQAPAGEADAVTASADAEADAVASLAAEVDPEAQFAGLTGIALHRAKAFAALRAQSERGGVAGRRVLLALGWLLGAAGRRDEALAAALAAAADLSAWDEDNAGIADCLAALGETESAERFRRRAANAAVRDFTWYELRARPLERANDWQGALAIWREAADTRVEPLRVAPRLARCHARRDEHAEAIAALAPVLALPVISTAVRKIETTALLKLGRQAEAIASLAQLVLAEPDVANHHRALANCLAATGGDLERACHHAQRAVELQPTPGHARLLAGLQQRLAAR
ncbi:hypothetical protein [Derxia gummosa]|uniref:Tetratricopeptide repeat protein n=1 Tax=Derxia gummosa DSM 723 TaxID=1121388 RepID=A0A8B6X500_9BURK|nr:hypothetical protein [Derxia gummosa]